MNSIKILSETDEHITIGGHGVVFGGVDLDGETFTKDTNYMLGLVPNKPLLYDHGGNKKHGIEFIGTVTKMTPDDTGLWMEAEIAKSDRYRDIVKLIEAERVGLSTGSVGHMTQRKGSVIKTWPIVEVSLTTTPAEHRTIGVARIKQLSTYAKSLEALLPEVAQDSDGGTATAPATISIIDNQEENIMSDEMKAFLEAQENRDEAMTKMFGDVVERLGDRSKLNDQLKDAGYIAPDDEEGRPDVKSLGDFFLAIKNKNVKRLKSVYKSQNEGTGTSGGFTVPHEFHNRLLELGGMESQIVSRVFNLPVATNSGEIPYANQTTAVTAGSGDTAFAAGITAENTAEEAALTETDAAFGMLQYKIFKIGGFTYMSNELGADSAFNIEALLGRMFGRATNSKKEQQILRGNGVGQMLGILNSAAAIPVTPATNNVFAYVDAVSMDSHFFSESGGSPVWIIHPGVMNEIAVMETSGGGAAWVSNMPGPLPNMLLGHPIIKSQHMPYFVGATGGDRVILADLNQYILFNRSGLTVEVSTDFAFTTDRDTWRFKERIDGKPWLPDVVPTAGPDDAFNLSPFVYFND